MLEERGIEHAAGSQAWLRRTLEEIVLQVRRLLDVTGVSFLVVDEAHAHIRPAASWFASDAVRDAFVPVLDRPYDPEHAGVTEAAVETVVGAEEIEHGRDVSMAVGERQAPHGHLAQQHVLALVVAAEALVRLIAEIGEGDGERVVAPVDQADREPRVVP